MIHIHEEVARCLLCADAPCTKVCTNGDPARAIRAILFDNEALAEQWVAKCNDKELQRAEEACIHYDRPIRIREILSQLSPVTPHPIPDTNSLAIKFCGFSCENPFFLASSAVCTNYDMISRAFDAGWAGVFYKTICKQEIREVSPRFDAASPLSSSYGEKSARSPFAGFRNMEQLSENPYEKDFEILRQLKKNYPTKMVIASIMGQYEEEWAELAQMAEDAGCDAVELNFSCPQMRVAGLGSDIGQNSELIAIYTTYVKQAVNIPVIPKMTPNITHMRQPGMSAYLAGADAISAINTIKSITMSPNATVNDKFTVSGYSGRAVKPIALRYIHEMASDSILGGSQWRRVEFSGIGGITTWRDAMDFIQMGCRNVQVCSAVMEYGYRIIDDLLLGTLNYMAERGVESIESLVGEKLSSIVQPHDLDRETIVYPKFNHDTCIGCGRCYTSCMDGGHQAIEFDFKTRQPKLNGSKCVGCHLCRLVCPTRSIGMSKRVKKKN